MKLTVKGTGVWGRGFQNWSEFVQFCTAPENDSIPAWSAPVPVHIPQRERRRAPLLVKLAVEVAHQACEGAGVDKSEIPSVFCSSMGDSDITDYMCRTLVEPTKVLSPTKFHNSVHNAPAGYWSISAENRAPSSSVANGRESFPVALLESAVLAVTKRQPVLLVAADVAVEGPLAGVFPIEEPFGAAMVLDPAGRPSDIGALDLSYSSGAADWPTAGQPHLRDLSEGNPSARCLALLETLALGNSVVVSLPLCDGAHLTAEVAGARG